VVTDPYDRIIGFLDRGQLIKSLIYLESLIEPDRPMLPVGAV
jgi:hypothetical protein